MIKESAVNEGFDVWKVSIASGLLHLISIMAGRGHTITCTPGSCLYVCVYRTRKDCTPPHVNLAQFIFLLCIYTIVKVST